MQITTSLVLAAFVGYASSWYMGWIDSSFALLLFIASITTGIYWLAEKLYFFPQRQKTLPAHQAMAQPWWLDWTAGLFPVVLAVFLMRSFLFEPFKIPSGSMIPTLRIGDLILVNKFIYGVRLPVFNHKIIAISLPKRGDVMVFRYPFNPHIDYIKRVVGLPGDEVRYSNKKLTINGKAIDTVVQPDFFDESTATQAKQFTERFPTGELVTTTASTSTINTSDNLHNNVHNVLNSDTHSAGVQTQYSFPFQDQCNYSIEGVVCKVPAGHYFMMGDNRDNSEDSRYWGFVPEENIVGKAFFVWMNFTDFKRIGGFN